MGTILSPQGTHGFIERSSFDLLNILYRKQNEYQADEQQLKELDYMYTAQGMTENSTDTVWRKWQQDIYIYILS